MLIRKITTLAKIIDQVMCQLISKNTHHIQLKEYTSYTTDGHKMTQWNDAGSYEGDPDVQYDTIRKQTEEGF